MGKPSVVHIRHILFSHKREENLPFATTWMKLEGIMLSEISHTEKYKYCTNTVEPKEKQTHRYREQTGVCQRRVMGRKRQAQSMKEAKGTNFWL